MGIRCFVFAVNKMDLVGYSEARFREIEAQDCGAAQELIWKTFTSSRYLQQRVTMSPKSENIPWYDGVPLLEYLENVDIHS